MSTTLVHTEEPREEAYDRRIDFALWRELWSYTRPYRKAVAGVCAFGSLVAAIDIAFPLITRRLIDEASAAANASGEPLAIDFTPYVLAYAALTLGICVSVFGFIWLAGRVRTAVAHDIRRAGFDNLQRLSFAFYDHRPVGWLMARMTSDCERLSNILAWGVLDLFWGTTLMVGISAILLWMAPGLALVVFCVIPILAWISLWFQKRILASSRAVRKTNSKLTAAFNESLMGARTTKVFVREEENAREFSSLSTEMFTHSMRNQLQNAIYLPLVLTLASVAAGLGLAFGGASVASGEIGLGTLIAFLFYTRFFFEPIQEMSHWFAEMQMAQASAERVLGLIAAVPDVQDSPEVAARIAAGRLEERAAEQAEDGHPDRIGDIEFRKVGFEYTPGQQVLAGLDFKVRAGETIALVGSTGGGKTTIVSLLSRFYEPTSGGILFDGIEYRDRGLHWLQSKLGIVLQTPHLFSGTIAENIRYGRLDATDEEVYEAARVVDAEEFILEFEDGYGTEVGECGNRLSTGQKQLLSLARAVLARPELLVLDEATSSVDTETERRVQQALERVLAGRTSFVVAHRLSTIRSADRILVVENGRLVEQGAHRELLGLRGRYSELYREQSLRESGRDERGWTGGGAPNVKPAPGV